MPDRAPDSTSDKIRPDSPFRAEALATRQQSWMGDIVLVRPLSFTVLCGGAVLCATAVMLFLVLGTYTKRSTVSGQLLPQTGLVKVHVPQPGVIVEKHVVEGQEVRQGDVLYTLSSERHSGTGGSNQALIGAELAARRQSLQEEGDKHRVLNAETRTALRRRMDSLQQEADKLVVQISDQTSRLGIAEQARDRYQELLGQAYVSREHLQQKQADVLDQRTRLQNLERERLATLRELGAQRHEFDSLAMKLENQLAQIDRGISSIEQEITENEGRRRLMIRAPESGIATTAVAQPGQAVDPSKPLVSIVPHGADLDAQLYARSRSMGFVKRGDIVLLRYTAYPYQKFGHARGTVADVARTALPGDELAREITAADGEPVYRITVRLDTQTILAYGKPQQLQSGMLVEADLLQETRHLYEWALEPLYSMGRKL